MRTHRTPERNPDLALRATSRRSGLSLLEVVFGLALATLCLAGLGAAYCASRQSFEAASARGSVIQHVREVLEVLRAADFDRVASAYDGHVFEILDLDAKGEVRFILDERYAGPDASEWGLPRDLDGDGRVQSYDVSSYYTLLPVEVRVTWVGPRGTETSTHHALLSDER